MALEGNGGTGMIMPVAPTGFMGNGYGTGLGGDGWWILLLFILLGGWNNNGYGAGAAGGAGGLYSWMNQSNQINDGFRDQMINSSITGIQQAVTAGFGDVQNALCGGFAGVNANIANAANQIEIAANGRQMADMQQNFALQTAMMQGFNATQAQQANGVRDIMENCNRNNQAVLDKLCQLELDGVKAELAQAQRENVGLQNQLNMAALRESQTAQNAFIQQGFSNEVDALYNRLNSCPVPTTPVYGRTPIFTCGGNGCGCGGNLV